MMISTSEDALNTGITNVIETRTRNPTIFLLKKGAAVIFSYFHSFFHNEEVF